MTQLRIITREISRGGREEVAILGRGEGVRQYGRALESRGRAWPQSARADVYETAGRPFRQVPLPASLCPPLLGGPRRVSNRKIEISSDLAPPINDVEHVLFTDAHSAGLGTCAPPPPHLPRFAAWARKLETDGVSSFLLPTPPSLPAQSINVQPPTKNFAAAPLPTHTHSLSPVAWPVSSIIPSDGES